MRASMSIKKSIEMLEETHSALLFGNEENESIGEDDSLTYAQNQQICIAISHLEISIHTLKLAE